MKKINVLLLTLMLTIGCLQHSGAAEVTTTDAHTYRLVVADVTWNQAYQLALNEGGYLATFETYDEFSNVLTQISNEGLSSIIFLIGGRRDPSGLQYHWIDRNNTLQGEVLNDPSSWLYPYWMSGEPSFQDINIQECYMEMYYYGNEGRWVMNDVPDDILSIVPSYSGMLGYIIEFGGDPAVSSPSEVSTVPAPDASAGNVPDVSAGTAPDAAAGTASDAAAGTVSDATADAASDVSGINGPLVSAGSKGNRRHTTAGTRVNADTWPEAYHNFIVNETYLTDPEKVFYAEEVVIDKIAFALRDMDADGTPELLIDNGGLSFEHSLTYLYSFSSPKVISVGSLPNPRVKNPYTIDQLSLPGLLTDFVREGDTTIDYYSYNGAVQSENVCLTALFVQNPDTGKYEMKRDPITGEGMATMLSHTSNAALYNAYHIHEKNLSKPFEFVERDSLEEMGWESFLSKYGYSADGTLSADSATGIDPSELLLYTPDEYYCSRDGETWTYKLAISDDGFCEGKYDDVRADETGEEHPEGTTYYSYYSGSFTDFQKVDDYTWSMRLSSLDKGAEAGDEVVSGNILYIATETPGITGDDLFYLYLPGHPVSTLPEGFMSWASSYMGEGNQDLTELNFFGLYNEAADYAWCSHG